MKPEIENLKALIFGKKITVYQRSLAIAEYHNLMGYIKHLEFNSSEIPDSSKASNSTPLK